MCNSKLEERRERLISELNIETFEGKAVKELSLNQLKKLSKRIKQRELYKLKDAIKKKEHKEKQESKQIAKKQRIEQLTEEEKLELKQRIEVVSAERRNARESKKRTMLEAMENNQKIVIDCDFSELMEQREQVSLCQQIGRSYGFNRGCDQPVSLHVVGLKGFIGDELRRKFKVDAWTASFRDEPLEDAFGDCMRQVVYLTADSDTELNTICKSDIYVIGGLVDRNRHKNVCLEKAKRLGIRTARLPKEALEGHTAGYRQVLTTNQVFSLLVAYINNRNWTQAGKDNIPQRKGNTDTKNKTKHSIDTGQDVQEDLEGGNNQEKSVQEISENQVSS